MKLVIATHNQNKLLEMQELLPKGWTLISLKDLNFEDEIPETGNTIEANAKQKAHHIHNLTNLNVLADDTGLEIDALDLAPGAQAAYYAGPQKSDKDNVDKVLSELKDKTNRNATFKTCMHLLLNGKDHSFVGAMKGSITEARRGLYGFGYDPIFVPEGSQKTYAEMFLDEKNRVSHRAKAIALLVDFLNQNKS